MEVAGTPRFDVAVHRLDQLSVDDLVECSQVFRGIAASAVTMEEAAQAITGYLHETFVDAAGAPATALVRLYKTHRFGDLETELQEFAQRADAAGLLDDDTRCLTLLGTSGTLPEWNDRRRSQGHRAIPLTSADVVAESPMIASLVSQLGIDVETVVAPATPDQTLALHHRDYDLFYVAEAEGSELVPAQEGFVVPHAIRSVVGCGGMLPSGDLFALIVFTRIPVAAETADLFRTLALSVKATIVRHTFKVFAEAT